MVISIKILLVFKDVSEKLRYLFEHYSVLLAITCQKSILDDNQTSILFTVACNMSTSHI